jgi:DNA polymerase III epsilon subunit-like protein
MMWPRLLQSFADYGDAFEWLGGSTPTALQERLKVASDGQPAYLVVDVESNGGGRGFGQLVVQLAFIVFDKDHIELHRYNELVQLPAGARIHYFAKKVHGISERRVREQGVDAHEALGEFICWCSRVDRVVAHNVAFDAAAIDNTCVQHCVEFELPIHKLFCTMRLSADHLNLRTTSGRRKMPKNTEFFEFFHGPIDSSAQLHDALQDALITAAGYRSGCEAGWW